MITDADSLGISVAVPFEITDNVVPVIVVKNIVGMLSVPVLLEYSEISLVTDGVGNVVLCALLFVRRLMVGVA